MRVCGINLLSNTGVRNTGFREGSIRTRLEYLGSGLQWFFGTYKMIPQQLGSRRYL
jgi:hypothetical protein